MSGVRADGRLFRRYGHAMSMAHLLTFVGMSRALFTINVRASISFSCIFPLSLKLEAVVIDIVSKGDVSFPRQRVTCECFGELPWGFDPVLCDKGVLGVSDVNAIGMAWFVREVNLYKWFNFYINFESYWHMKPPLYPFPLFLLECLEL